jgi:hypothetical protein
MAVMIISSGSASAGNIYDILINDDNSGTDQTSPKVTLGPLGQFVIVWADKRNGQSDIYCQYYDSNGTAVGSNLLINDDNSNIPQFEPSISGNGSGQNGAVWKDYRNGSYPFHPDIYYSEKGIDIWETNRNITSELPDSTCESPDIAIFSNGSSVIVWSDYRNKNWDIYGQRIGVDGEPVGTNFKINTDAGTNAQHMPRVAARPDGGFVVVWYDNRLTNDDIFGQRYDASFNAVGTNFKISDDSGTSRQAFPVVACDGSRRFFVAWVDWRNGSYPSNPDIFMRRFDSSGTALGSSRQINTSDAGRSQRDVAICADWMGNICVVWADSSSSQWDSYGQIIDYAGKSIGGSFLIHQLTTGKQLQPDVESDGYRICLVWADSRSGNFDIYATIRKYNDPNLIAQPSSLSFEMEDGGTLPEAINVTLRNAGLGELGWQAVPDVNWISVNPAGGMTPDTFMVSIVDDTIPYGDYFGQIRLIDLDHNDSATAIPVRLSVTAPLIEVTPDTLVFRVFASLGNPTSQKFQIDNIGTGSLSWVGSENGTWISINETTGMEGDYCTVNIEIGGLEYGDYYEPVVFSSTEAANSPETAWVYLSLVGNMPYLAGDPESLYFTGNVGTAFEGTVTILNLGTGVLNWSLINIDDRIIPDRTSGNDNDAINFELSTSALNSGQYQFYLNIYDSASFNQETNVPITVILYPNDTVLFQDVAVNPGETFKVPINIKLSEYCRGGYIPFGFDSSMILIDSIVFNVDSIPLFLVCQQKIYNNGGEIGFATSPVDSLIPPTDYHIADMYMTACLLEGVTSIDTLSIDSGTVYIIDSAGVKMTPFVKPGNIQIGEHTDIADDHHEIVPNEMTLRQNSPNPFNSSTQIIVDLPRSKPVNLSIYNILGQEISCLYDGVMPAGINRLKWDGTTKGGVKAPSGIYFYRLFSDNEIRVKKMVLLK